MPDTDSIFKKVFALEPIENKAKGSARFTVQDHIEKQLNACKEALIGSFINFIHDEEARRPYLKSDKEWQDSCEGLTRFSYKILRHIPEEDIRAMKATLDSYKGVEISHGKWELFSTADIIMAFTLAVQASGQDIKDQFSGRLVFIP